MQGIGLSLELTYLIITWLIQNGSQLKLGGYHLQMENIKRVVPSEEGFAISGDEPEENRKVERFYLCCFICDEDGDNSKGHMLNLENWLVMAFHRNSR